MGGTVSLQQERPPFFGYCLQVSCAPPSFFFLVHILEGRADDKPFFLFNINCVATTHGLCLHTAGHPTQSERGFTTSSQATQVSHQHDRQEYLCQVSKTDGGNMFIDLLNY